MLLSVCSLCLLLCVVSLELVWVFGFDFPASVNQDNDWLLVSRLNQQTCPPSQVLTDPSTATLTLTNSLILRSFLTVPCFATVELQRSSSLAYGTNFTYLRTLAPEGNISFDGIPFDIGGCQGIPLGHPEFYTPEQFSPLLASNRSFTFSSYSVSSPVADYPWQPQRGAPPDMQWPPKGLHLAVELNPPTSADWLQFTGVSVTVHYEIYDCLPILRKWVTVQNDRKPFFLPIEISTLMIEMLRVPNGAPERMSVLLDKPFNPTPWDDQVLNAPDGLGLGNSAQIWFIDADYDACCDQELHVPYTYYTYLQAGYAVYDVFYGTSVGPGVLLAGGTDWESISIRLVLHDSNELERKGLETRRIQSLLAPQLMENPLAMMITDIGNSSAFEWVIDEAAQAGLEMLVIGFGANGYCGLCDDQMFNETWRNWFAGELAYAHSRGLEVTAYTLMQHNGWGEDTPDSEQVLGPNGQRQGIACFATDWHAQYRQNVLEFMKNVSLDGIETDGQYEYAACYDATGDHYHNGVRGSWDAQLRATTSFNSQLKEINGFQSGADAYQFSGANRWNHADTDAGFALEDFWEFTSMGRLYAYDSTYTRLASSGMIAVLDIASIALTGCGPALRLSCVDFALGTLLSTGTIPVVRADSIVPPGDNDRDAILKVFLNWTTFWKKYRQILIGEFLHLIAPTNRLIEATAHLDSYTCLKQGMCALVTIVNPTAQARKSGRIALSLYLAALQPGTPVWTQQIQNQYQWNADQTPKAGTAHTVGKDGVGIYEILLDDTLIPPRSYVVILVTSYAAAPQAIPQSAY